MINYIYRLKRAKISKKSLLFLIPIATVFLFPNTRNSVVYIFVFVRPVVPVLFSTFVPSLRSVPSFRPSVPFPSRVCFSTLSRFPFHILFSSSVPFPFFCPVASFPSRVCFPTPPHSRPAASFPSRRLAPTRTLLFVDTFSAVILPVVRPQM